MESQTGLSELWCAFHLIRNVRRLVARRKKHKQINKQTKPEAERDVVFWPDLAL